MTTTSDDWELKLIAWAFAAYVEAKILLRMGVRPHLIKLPPVPGYDQAIDPDSIRAPYSVSSPTERDALASSDLGWANVAVEFCTMIEAAVDGLPDLEREIVRACYMDLDHKVTERGAWERLQRGRADYPEFRTFQRVKRDAARRVAIAIDAWLIEHGRAELDHVEGRMVGG